MRKFGSLFVATFAALAGGSAASSDLYGFGGARFNVPVTSLKEARYKTTLRQQYDFSCGSAAVATLLTHHYGFPVTEQAVFEHMYATGDKAKIRREGFSLLDMKRYLKANGFVADGFNLPLEKLVEAGYPAIVLVSEKGYNHFVVVKGIRDGRVLLGDPAGGTRSVARAHFDDIWKSRLLFVIHKAPTLADFNATRDWRAAPSAPLAAVVNGTGIDTLGIIKNGPGDF